MKPRKEPLHIPAASINDEITTKFSDNQYLIQMDIPGIKEEDLKLTFKDERLLNIHGFRYFQGTKEKKVFAQSYRVPTYNVDATQIKAALSNGVLRILIPKKTKIAPHSVHIVTDTKEDKETGNKAAGAKPIVSQNDAPKIDSEMKEMI